MATAHRSVRSTSLHVDEGAREVGGGRSGLTPLTRLRAGDPEALAEILDRYWNGCVLYARNLLDRRDEGDIAEDLVQEAFIRLWQHRSRWKPDSSPRYILLRILRNLILNEARHLSVMRRWSEQVEATQRRPNPTPDEVFALEQVRARVRQAVAALPPRRREIFLLVRQQGLAYSEVARILGISRQTVANQMSAALQALRDAIEPFL